MPHSLTCLHCGKTVPLNPRLKKNQHYCSAQSCQQARRSARKKERYKIDPVYRKKQLEGQKAWREKRPSHQYQRAYREDHPEYVKRNRNLQRERNKKRQGAPGPMIVNGTSLFTQGSNEEAYAVFKIKNEKIVNGTSFIARMKILSRKEAILVQHGL